MMTTTRATSFALLGGRRHHVLNTTTTTNKTRNNYNTNKNNERGGLRCFAKAAAAKTTTKKEDVPKNLERLRISTPWEDAQTVLKSEFKTSEEDLKTFGELTKEELENAYEMMQLCRDFENECNQSYMGGKIRGFMHLDNGQESIPALLANSIRKSDLKHSYYRDHCHAIACGVDAGKVMAELYGKDGGTCRGTGGSMHIYDVENNFQGGWALVSEQLPYAVGAARSIVLDKFLGKEGMEDERIAIVFVGEGGAQNGRMAECLNAAAKENLPILFLVIDNGRAINTFTKDVAQNQSVFEQGKHYGVPGVLVDGQDVTDVLKVGKAAINHVRTKGPAILQVHTFRFNGHSPADPEHERNRKDEKRWARKECDPITIFEQSAHAQGLDLQALTKKAKDEVKRALDFADASPPPPPSLAAELEYPDPNGQVDYSQREPEMGLAKAQETTKKIVDPNTLAGLEKRIADLRGLCDTPQGISIGDAVNLAVLEEMLRDPTCLAHAEDLQAGSSYNIPANTQQAFGRLRAADEIIDEGHFIGKALGEAMNGYRPIVELMNANFGIYGMAELSSAGNTYATTGGQFKMPMTVIGAGGTAPNQSLGAEHSQPFHAYIMGIPGLKICSASKPNEAYGLAKSMIRDNGPGVLLLPVKMMKTRGPCNPNQFLPLHKSTQHAKASDAAVKANKAITVVTYLHGVKESEEAMKELAASGIVDWRTIQSSLERTHKLIILDESTRTGGVGATLSAIVSENLFDELDAPVMRLCMEDAPVPYAGEMEKEVVKRASDLVEAAKFMCGA
ncbi:unnamed protein product [Bathycoccus prasinos]